MQHKKQLILGIVLSIAFAWYAFSGVDMSKLWEILRASNRQRMLYYLGWIFLSFLLRAQRSKLITDHSAPLSLNGHFSLTAISFMLNNFFPARMGDLAKAYLTGKKLNISASTGLGVVVLERLFDLLGLVSITIVAIMTQNVSATLRNFTALFAALFLVVLVAIYLMHFHIDKIATITHKLLFFIPLERRNKLIELMELFSAGLTIMEHRRDLFYCVLLSLGVWISITGSTYECGQIIGLPLGFLESVSPVAFTGVGVMIPAAPGFVGTFHTFCIKGLEALNLNDPNLNAAFAVFAHGANYIYVSIQGLIYFGMEHISLSELETIEIQDLSSKT